MFLDVANIFCKAGNGGDGTVSWHREKYLPNGGPDGGDGGRGGSIYFVADPSVNTLIGFRYTQHFRAINGDRGGNNNMIGKSGDDIIIKVPRGTIIKDAETDGIIADIFHYDEQVLILSGGKGGRGNARFNTALRRSPNFCEKGEDTIERKIKLELKTIADVGLIGYPNVGKSTLLSVISAAKPKIANYHFTTLSPNLGVVAHYDSTFVVADIPGLIEGASDGAGLGHDFLRHVERVRLLVHLVDISGSEGRDPLEDYKVIRKELKKYSPILAKLPEILVANKSDLSTSKDNIKALRAKTRKRVIEISAATTDGIKVLVDAIAEKLKALPPVTQSQFEQFRYEDIDIDSFNVRYDGGAYYVTGGYLEALAKRVILDDPESFRYFQKMLREKGIIKALKEKGAKQGDTVCVLDIEFEYVD